MPGWSTLFLPLLSMAVAEEEWSEWITTPRVIPNPDFVFPDQLPRLRKAMPEITSGPVPRGCGGRRDYCEAVSEYPHQGELRRRLGSLGRLEAQLVFPPLEGQQAGEVRARLGMETPSTYRGERYKSALEESEEEEEDWEMATTRKGSPFVQESPACDSEHSFIYPRTARNRGRQWRFVINVPGEVDGQQDYVQAVKVTSRSSPRNYILRLLFLGGDLPKAR